MRSLREAQAQFQAVLLEDFEPQVLREAPRIAIYHRAYRARLEGALRSNYPAIARLLGERDFAVLSERYAAAHPSRAASIRWHGAALADFALGDPVLRDLARLEWALGLAFDAADTPPLDTVALAGIEPGRLATLELALHPSVSVLALRWAVGPLWDMLRNTGEAAARPPSLRHAMLVWRQGGQAAWRTLQADEAGALRGFRRRATLHAVAARAQRAGQDPERVGAWFAQWVATGVLAVAAAR